MLETAVKEAGQSPLAAGGAAQPVARVLQARRWRDCAIPSRPTRRSRTWCRAAKAPKRRARRAQGVGGACRAARRIAALKANKIQQAEDAWDAASRPAATAPASSGRPTTSWAPSSSSRTRSIATAAARPSARARSSCSRSSCRKATGGDGRSAARAVALGATSSLGYDFYQRGDEKRAGQISTCGAEGRQAKGDKRELDHNLARHRSRSRARRRRRRRCSRRSARGRAEALVNLGILRDRQGESKKALDLYSRPRRAERARRSWASGST